MKFFTDPLRLPSFAVHTALKAAVKCTLYNFPDGGNWDNCKSECEDDNACRLGYESADQAYAFLQDRQKFVDNSYICINYWCRGFRHYNKNSNYWRFESSVSSDLKK